MWIEVTTAGGNQKFAINFDHVIQISPLAQGTLIIRGANERVQVMESYDYIVARLHAAAAK
ncbi:hypothetical protein RMR16_005705 [Agrobacterium sp. rho-13.3]|jgi:hypothetical protein|uniref:hypothetical protein n=1 Tax=Agrobacterium sp. rho-13.3 TaxID=3072980 RepID=UPI002A143C4F|nr:hypothetical protein [Agrobacterium sp. rho-13.3]MDX8309478.1 hypothetical protein [Agrobacterium sp. rho-13.3]